MATVPGAKEIIVPTRPLVAPVRHPLGLPSGSVRALLAFMVFGLYWALLLIPEQTPQGIPTYLYYLMFLILGHYFASRGNPVVINGVRQAPPLHLPHGTVRILIVVGFAVVLAWGFYNDPHFEARLNPDITQDPHLPVIVLGAFFIGLLVGRIGSRIFRGPTGVSPAFQDVLAAISLLAMLLLIAEILIRLVINPTLSPDKQLHLPQWERFLAAFVAFYFGARS